MSSYENYDRVSGTYDRTRRPVGIAVILDCLSRDGRDAAAMTLLDAGCGTGAFAAALAPHLRRIVALDINAGMLRQARGKTFHGDTVFLRGSIAALPIGDGALDAVLNNLVLHHLPDNPAAGYAAHRRAIREFARVLKPGGRLVVGVCTREQLREGFWFNHLIPRAIDAVCAKTIPLDDLQAMIGECGFSLPETIVPADEILQGDSYFDTRGPLDPAWRDGDSVWSLAPPDELAAAIARIRMLDRSDSLDEFVRKMDAKRHEIGQITFLTAVRR
jgi:ubiquinone/menaquinone biosynthesis C-methylase UbiE